MTATSLLGAPGAGRVERANLVVTARSGRGSLLVAVPAPRSGPRKGVTARFASGDPLPRPAIGRWRLRSQTDVVKVKRRDPRPERERAGRVGTNARFGGANVRSSWGVSTRTRHSRVSAHQAAPRALWREPPITSAERPGPMAFPTTHPARESRREDRVRRIATVRDTRRVGPQHRSRSTNP